MPKKGEKAPDFTLPNQNNEEITLSDLKGQKVVLYFYPKDNTSTCTVQACNLRDHHTELGKAGYKVFGISPDSAKSHTNFINKYDLNFDLLADTEKEVVQKYGVWAKKKMYGREYMGVLRTTFIIDENGVITDVIEKVKAKEHSDQIMSAD